MDLSTRKYQPIQELVGLENETILEMLEHILQQENAQPQDISDEIKKELDLRLKSYKENPDDLLDWQKVRDSW